MIRTARPYAALLVLAAAFGALFLLLAPAASARTVAGDGGPAPVSWAAQVVGPGTELSSATDARITQLRDLGCEGLHAHVPAAQIVAGYADELGNRTDAVTLFGAMSPWCGYAG